MSGDTTLAYRTMMLDSDGQPECGVGSRRRPLLGVRPGIDVVPNEDGMVPRDSGRGMSVAPAPESLPPHYRPMRFGGTSSLPCWALDLSRLPDSLEHVPTSETHAVITNVDVIAVDDLQAVLCRTAPEWKAVP